MLTSWWTNFYFTSYLSQKVRSLQSQLQSSKEDNKSREEEIINLLFDNDQIAEDSIFRQFNPVKQQEYIASYIRYQYEMDPGQFYNPRYMTSIFRRTLYRPLTCGVMNSKLG